MSAGTTVDSPARSRSDRRRSTAAFAAAVESARLSSAETSPGRSRYPATSSTVSQSAGIGLARAPRARAARHRARRRHAGELQELGRIVGIEQPLADDGELDV